MKKLVLLRGVPGSGKSSFIDKFKLKPWTISPDAIRQMYQGPQDCGSCLRISQANDTRVWAIVDEMLNHRMSLNEPLIILDATHANPNSITSRLYLCHKPEYDCIVVNFDEDYIESSSASLNLGANEILLMRNEHRMKSNDSIPDDVLVRMINNFKKPIPAGALVLTPSQFEEFLVKEFFPLYSNYWFADNAQ
jgi:predicted kinase